MTTPDPSTIAQALLTSSGFARVALTAPSERLRQAAAAELAETICQRLAAPPLPHRDQLTLPL